MTKKKITNMEAFNLASKLQTPEILEIKDTDFAMAVYTNSKLIIAEYEKISPLLTPSDEWNKLVDGLETQEELNKLQEDSANDDIFAKRQTQIDEYNKVLEKPFKGVIKKVKINNTSTKLSAKDLMDLEVMIKL